MRLPRPRRFFRAALWLLLAAGSAAIAYGSLVYFGEDLAPFVLEKLQLALPNEDLWIFALKVHVVAAAFSLPACLLLSTQTVIKRTPRFHRWLGRVAGVVILLALVPSGLYMSLFAKGGLPSTLGFALSGLVVGVAMVQGVRTARARRFIEHRRWALHVVGQLSVAVVSRAMLFAFDAAGVEEELAYLVSLWLPVVGSLVLVELASRRPSLAIRRNRTHEALLDARPLRLRDLRPDAPRVARGG